MLENLGCIQLQGWKTNKFDEEAWSRLVGWSVSRFGERKEAV